VTVVEKGLNAQLFQVGKRCANPQRLNDGQHGGFSCVAG